MKKMHFISLILLFLFVISISFSAVSAADEDRSYTIPFANIDLFIGVDGNLHVKEQIHYSFSGIYHGVYRNIPFKDGERIENFKIYTKGAYSSYEVTNKTDSKYIKIYLYSDSQKKAPIEDKDADVFIEYDFINKIKIYNDIAELYHNLWGEEWEESPNQLKANIYLKSNNNVKYWLNPPYFVQNDSWDGTTLKIITKPLYQGDAFKLRMAIPKDQFMASPPYAQKINGNGLEKIEEIQKNYEDELNSLADAYKLWALIMLLSIIFPLIIYITHGRDPKINYQAEYEYDLPTNDPPAVVNAIYGDHFNIGKPNIDGYKATILDLIARDYLLIEEVPPKGDESKVIELRVNPYSRRSELKKFELSALRYMETFKRNNNIISLDRFQNSLNDERKANNFKKSYNRWERYLEREFLNDEIMANIYVKTGTSYIKIYGIFGLIVAVLTFIFSYFDIFPAASYTFYGSIVLGIVSITVIIMRQSIGGHWTVYGKENYVKWQNFGKYIKNFELMKEYSPESPENLNKYIVYGTALGVANEIKEPIEELIKLTGEVFNISMSLIYYFEIFDMLSSSLDSMSTAGGSDDSDGSSGWFGSGGDSGGDGGGGGGGDGGGAF